MKKRFTEEQIVGILRQAEAEAEVDGMVIRDLCRKHNITEQTLSGGGTSTTGRQCQKRVG
jgi:putative transposase